jgi:hypothetical protein
MLGSIIYNVIIYILIGKPEVVVHLEDLDLDGRVKLN